MITGERAPNGLYDIKVKDKVFKFPSVTTILGTMKNPELDKLIKDIGDKDEFKKITNRAGNRGNVMHLYLENFAIGLDRKLSQNDALLFSQKETNKAIIKYTEFEQEKGLDFFYNIYHSPFTDEILKPLVIEGLMVSFKEKYAGRTDLIYADVFHNIILSDYKSSSAIVLEGTTKYVKYKLQLAAYWNAFEEIHKHKIKEGVVWVGNPTGFQKIVLSKHEYPIYLEYFLKLRREF
jgi:hypothetical protein